MQRTKYTLFVILVVISVLAACSAPPTADLPQTEAEVPRVPLEEAKTALDSGAAILVDVRSPDAFAASHAVGAISIPLGEIERNITGLPLEKDQWIITYCT